ncbi:MAG: hypothetical protein AABW83_02760 [Nanoarchaeota archaeon]
MKSSNQIVLFSIFILIVIILVTNVYAITGSIGNARMILRLEIGDKIEKSILVKNINDVPVNIELIAIGDLEDYITIKDKSFSLQPKEEKKAFFTIDVKKGGTTETKINVKFSPIDGGNGVGLSSTIIVITEDEDNWNLLNIFNKEDKNSNVSVGIGEKKVNVDETKNDSNSLVKTSLIFSFILFIILLVLLFLASKHIKKKREIKTKKSFRNE